jgi:hypothetical protein
MSVIINGDTGINKITDGSIVTSDFASTVPLGTKNLIINGNMQIAQRGTTTAGITSGNNFVLDRFIFNTGSIGTWTLSQDTDAPDGFSNSMKLQCTTANASPTGTNWCNFQQRIEAQNLQHLAYGTSSAKTITLSFWVKSNKTGTYTAMIYGYDSSPARTISAEYTISAADTWEKKTITFAGDSSGQIDNDNGAGFNIYWALGTGPDRKSSPLQTSWGAYDSTAFVSSSQVNLADNTANYINITGVQLETGTTATDFEHLQYGQQLALCQRYYQSFGGSNANETVGQGTSFSTTNTYVLIHLLQTMRSVPSFGYSAVGDWRLHYPGVTGQEATVMAISTSDSNNTRVIVNTTTATNASMGGGKCIQLTADNTISARLTFSAEL